MRVAGGFCQIPVAFGLLAWLGQGCCDTGTPLANKPDVADQKKPAGTSTGIDMEKKEDALEKVILQDIHPLYGGHYLYLRGDGSGFCRVITRRPKVAGLQETRFDIPHSPDTMKRLGDLMRQYHFFQISIAERPGIPDEARPTITVALVSGKSARVSKWANDKVPDFDAVYQALLDQVQIAQKGKPAYEGPFDSKTGLP